MGKWRAAPLSTTRTAPFPKVIIYCNVGRSTKYGSAHVLNTRHKTASWRIPLGVCLYRSDISAATRQLTTTVVCALVGTKPEESGAGPRLTLKADSRLARSIFSFGRHPAPKPSGTRGNGSLRRSPGQGQRISVGHNQLVATQAR